MERRRRLAATLGLLALVVVDLVLVFAALRFTGRSSATDPAEPSMTLTDSVAGSSATSQTAPDDGTAAPGTTSATLGRWQRWGKRSGRTWRRTAG